MRSQVIAFAGSLRKGSYNRCLIENSKRLAPEGMEFEHVFLDDVPLYNTDVETEKFPEAVVRLKEQIRAADGVLMAVPEHNFSFSAVLKNVTEWLSRPPRENSVLENKPVILQSASTSWSGGLRAQLQLHQTLNYFPVRLMRFPEVCVGNCATKFDDAGILIDEPTVKRIQTQLGSFQQFMRGEG